MKIVWGIITPIRPAAGTLAKFFSDYVSSAQRAAQRKHPDHRRGHSAACSKSRRNMKRCGNTISPYYQEKKISTWSIEPIACHIDYVPQLKAPSEEPIIPPDNSKLRLKDLIYQKVA